MADLKYVLSDIEQNSEEAYLDGLTVSKAGEGVPLTDDQVKRLRVAGLTVEVYTARKSKPSPAPTPPDPAKA